MAHDITEVKRKLKNMATVLNFDEMATIDFDNFWHTIEKINTTDATPTSECEMILEAWNFFEDLINTFNISDLSDQLHGSVLDKAYKKIFYGNNLKSITPKDELYNPMWHEEEINEFKVSMKTVWDELKKYTNDWGQKTY